MSAMTKCLKRLGWKRCWGQSFGFVQRLWLRRSQQKTIRKLLQFVVCGAIALVMVAHPLPTWSEQASARAPNVTARVDGQTIAQVRDPDFPLQPHPLPPALAQWHDVTGDYFDQVEVVPVGYLVWSHFPLTVYIEPPSATELASPFTAQRAQVWIKAVSQAVQEWNRYLSLMVVDQANGADLAILRSPPPLEVKPPQPQSENNGSGQVPQRPTLPISRARSAVTRYKVYVKGSAKDAAASKPMLAFRCTIQLRPDQAPQYLQAAARHELGHALGIWGHSRSQTDVMYFSQVRNPPPISPRDLNTLKRIYQQPTRLGWALSE